MNPSIPNLILEADQPPQSSPLGVDCDQRLVRCISLWQPWASLMACGAKWLETRGWDTKVRGMIHIHAAKTTKGLECAHAIDDLDTARRIKAMEEALGVPCDEWETALPFGQIIARGVLDHTLPTELAAYRMPSQIPFGDFTPGRFAHFYQDLEPITPIPCRGKQGFFFAPNSDYTTKP